MEHGGAPSWPQTLPLVKARGMPNAPSPLLTLRYAQGRQRRGKKNPWILVDCLDPFFDWIPDQVGDRRRGQASRMTDGGRVGIVKVQSFVDSMRG